MKKQSNAEALVIGGGVAGPVVAMFLQRIGVQPVIYEARDRPADDRGAFLNLAPNGLDVLRQLGILEAVQAQGHDCPTMIFRGPTGRELGRLEDDEAARREGLGSLIIKRGLLSAVLREEAVRRGIRYEHGKRLDYARMADDGVVARFADGSEARGRFLLGCDGIHSRTRDVLFPEAPTPEYTGLIDCGGFARVPGLAATDGAMNFVFGRRAFFGYFVAPTGEVYWFQNTWSPGDAAPEALRSDEAWMAHLLALHADDPSPVPEILAATAGAVGRWPLHDMPPLPSWHRGNGCLVGDAAHAVSPHGGNGASLAFEDAVVLARCLRDAHDPPRAFAAYQMARKDRVERIARRARKNGGMKGPTGPAGAFIRDLFMPLFLRMGARAIAEVHDYRVPFVTSSDTR